MQEARFGPAYRAKAVIYRPRMSIGHLQESSIPNGVHWDLFLGPAPYREFTLNRFQYGWHYYWDFATTEMGNNGVHIIDLVRWALNKNVHPVKVHCDGGLYADKSDQETPNVQMASYEYADGTLVELDMTTLQTPSFGGERYGAFFYTPQGYIMTRPQTRAIIGARWLGECVPRDTPDPPSGISLRAVNLSFPKMRLQTRPRGPQDTPGLRPASTIAITRTSSTAYGRASGKTCTARSWKGTCPRRSATWRTSLSGRGES